MQYHSKHCVVAVSPLELVFQSRRSRRPASKRPTPVGRARQLRPDEIDQLVVRYREVRSVNTVAREFGISRQTVGQHLAARGVETMRRISDGQIELATRRYVGGLSAATIGKQLGFDAQTILTALRRAGVPIRPRRGA
ncbi:helix-turn-helix domain-containing protein [Agromyces sp. ISL-38]|nr:helix-turn-helix domain-containing protein [Agromyces sp. ISL-38]